MGDQAGVGDQHRLHLCGARGARRPGHLARRLPRRLPLRDGGARRAAGRRRRERPGALGGAVRPRRGPRAGDDQRAGPGRARRRATACCARRSSATAGSPWSAVSRARRCPAGPSTSASPTASPSPRSRAAASIRCRGRARRSRAAAGGRSAPASSSSATGTRRARSRARRCPTSSTPTAPTSSTASCASTWARSGARSPPPRSHYPGGEEQLAAKLVGRWRDGTPLDLSPDRPVATIVADPARNNAFSYLDDPDGLRCPAGSHIRRANPRHGLPFEGKLVNRHRLIRRGIPYGDPLPAGRRGRRRGPRRRLHVPAGEHRAPVRVRAGAVVQRRQRAPPRRRRGRADGPPRRPRHRAR